jgi:hypothetical protein
MSSSSSGDTHGVGQVGILAPSRRPGGVLALRYLVLSVACSVVGLLVSVPLPPLSETGIAPERAVMLLSEILGPLLSPMGPVPGIPLYQSLPLMLTGALWAYVLLLLTPGSLAGSLLLRGSRLNGEGRDTSSSSEPVPTDGGALVHSSGQNASPCSGVDIARYWTLPLHADRGGSSGLRGRLGVERLWHRRRAQSSSRRPPGRPGRDRQPQVEVKSAACPGSKNAWAG